MFSALFHLDEARLAEFLQMETKGRWDFFHAQHVATHFAYRGTRNIENVFSILDADSTACLAKKAVDSQSSWVGQGLHHWDDRVCTHI